MTLTPEQEAAIQEAGERLVNDDCGCLQEHGREFWFAHDCVSEVLRDLARRLLEPAEKERDALKGVLAEEVGTNMRQAQRLGFWHLIEAGESYVAAEIETFEALRRRLAQSEAALMRIADRQTGKRPVIDAIESRRLARAALAKGETSQDRKGETK